MAYEAVASQVCTQAEATLESSLLSIGCALRVTSKLHHVNLTTWIDQQIKP